MSNVCSSFAAFFAPPFPPDNVETCQRSMNGSCFWRPWIINIVMGGGGKARIVPTVLTRIVAMTRYKRVLRHPLSCVRVAPPTLSTVLYFRKRVTSRKQGLSLKLSSFHLYINDEMNHILNCGYEIKWSYDPRSYDSIYVSFHISFHRW